VVKRQSLTEIKFATSEHHRISVNNAQCVYPPQEQTTNSNHSDNHWSIASLISSWLIMSCTVWHCFTNSVCRPSSAGIV